MANEAGLQQQVKDLKRRVALLERLLSVTEGEVRLILTILIRLHKINTTELENIDLSQEPLLKNVVALLQKQPTAKLKVKL